VPALGSLDGHDVAIAIVDSGIDIARLEHLLDEILFPKRTVYLDKQRSWKPPTLVTEPGNHRIGHGTMCAYDALIAAPKATLLDVPMLLVRDAGDHHTTGTVAAATLAFQYLLNMWTSGTTPPFKALVVSNSWGIFHPSLEDYPPGSNSRFIDNAMHPFRGLVVALATVGVDVVFCGNNCGNLSNCAGTCASGTCLSKTDRMIMGANAYPEVLTIGGCDANDRMVGYSSSGPVIAGMFPPNSVLEHKPDLVAYTHFLGSKAVTCWVPDTGVSAACPVAAGCVAALRTRWSPQQVPPAMLFQKLRDTARTPVGGTTPPGQWDPAYGYGIIDPLAATAVLPP